MKWLSVIQPEAECHQRTAEKMFRCPAAIRGTGVSELA